MNPGEAGGVVQSIHGEDYQTLRTIAERLEAIEAKGPKVSGMDVLESWALVVKAGNILERWACCKVASPFSARILMASFMIDHWSMGEGIGKKVMQ